MGNVRLRAPESADLLVAIRVDPDIEVAYWSEDIDEALLLDLCNNFLVLDSLRNVWRFSHLSATEYLKQNHWDLQTAHCFAAKVCLKLPLTESLGGWVTKPGNYHSWNRSLQAYPDLRWVAHLQTQDHGENDHQLVAMLKFLGSPSESSPQYRSWHNRIASYKYRSRLHLILQRGDCQCP